MGQGQLEGFHQLRHRQVENVIWIDVHLLLPGELPLEEAHRRVTSVEANIRKALPHGQVQIASHLEPSDHLSAHPDGHEQEDPLHDPLGDV